MDSDLIVVMADGRIAEQGTPAELRARTSSLFYEMLTAATATKTTTAKR
jgi:ABC-type multidrug transport system fused ATPase/permease subunit